MRKYLFICFALLCLVSCNDEGAKESASTIKGHLIEGHSGRSLSDVKVSLFDDVKVYAIAFSDENGMFTMSTPPLLQNYYYKLSFYWDSEYPAKEISLYNIPEVFDLHDFVVYDETNPYDYKIFDGYMIHKTLPGTYTFSGAKAACRALRDGYDDWTLPEADYLDILADNEELAKQIAEPGWYWSSWVIQSQYYIGINILENEEGSTTDPSEKLKVLPVRRIDK